MFSYEFCEIFKSTSFTEHFWAATSDATWFFPVETHLFQLSLKSDKGSVEYPPPDTIRLNLNNDYKKGLTLQ